MKNLKTHLGGLLLLVSALSILSSCAIPTACGQTKGQAKKQHKKYQWKTT